MATATSLGSIRPGTSEFSAAAGVEIYFWDGSDSTWAPAQQPTNWLNDGVATDMPPTAGIAAVISSGRCEVGPSTQTQEALLLDVGGTGTVRVTHDSGGLPITAYVNIDTGGTLEVDRDTQVSCGEELAVASGGVYSPQIGETSSGLIAAGGNVYVNSGSEVKFRPTGASMFKAGTYTLITAAAGSSIAGTFSVADGLGDYFSNFTYGSNSVSVTVSHDLHPGDANLDKTTDVRDFNVWNSNKFGSDKEWTQGDFDGNRVTDVRDFNRWNTAKFTSVGEAAAGPGELPAAGGNAAAAQIATTPGLIYWADYGTMFVYNYDANLTSMVIEGPSAVSIDRWQSGTFQDGMYWSQRNFAGAEQWYGGMDGGSVPQNTSFVVAT